MEGYYLYWDGANAQFVLTVDGSSLQYLAPPAGYTIEDFAEYPTLCTADAMFTMAGYTAYDCLDEDTNTYFLVVEPMEGMLEYFADGDYLPNTTYYWDGTSKTFTTDETTTTTITASLLSLSKKRLSLAFKGTFASLSL